MERQRAQTYIFLDPDGTHALGLVVIVAAATGVTYAHQGGGSAAITCAIEGFAVPLGDTEASQPLRAFFRRRFHGNPPAMPEQSDVAVGAQWTFESLDELSALVERVAFWKTYAPGAGMDDKLHYLQLDRTRLNQLTEGWVPVSTAYGPGVLIFTNTD